MKEMKKDLQILMLEDAAEDAALVQRVLRKAQVNFTSKRVDTRDEFVNAIRSSKPDIVLSDHSLPEFNSIEALRLLKNEDPEIPFILVTGSVSEEFSVMCLKLGAYDYVLKSNLTRLPSAVMQALDNREAHRLKHEAEGRLLQQNEELQSANMQLRKINSELDNFVYSVSHNLRGPLSSILGIVNISRLGAFPNDVDPMELIEHAVQKLDITLKEILDYSKNARESIKIAPIDMQEIFHRNFEKLKFLPAAQQLNLEYSFNGSQPVLTDFYRMNVITSNLLSNSVQFSDPKKSVKTIKLTVDTTDDYVLEFEDNGLGISKDVLPNIFTMFFRGHETSQGAGLGLYIVKEAVEKLQGEIAVTSQLGVGTKMQITLPRIEHG